MFASDRPSWQNPKVLSVLILVFVAGAFTGALSMRLGLHDRLHANAGGGTGLRDPIAAKTFLTRCQGELNLTSEQTDQMKSILDDYKLYYQSVQDQIVEVRATGKNRIMAVLNPDQKVKFEKLLAEMK